MRLAGPPQTLQFRQMIAVAQWEGMFLARSTERSYQKGKFLVYEFWWRAAQVGSPPTSQLYLFCRKFSRPVGEALLCIPRQLWNRISHLPKKGMGHGRLSICQNHILRSSQNPLHIFGVKSVFKIVCYFQNILFLICYLQLYLFV